MGDAGVAHRATTKYIKVLLERSVIVSAWTLRGSCLIWFVPLHGHSLIKGNSKNGNHPEVVYFKAFDITDDYMDLFIIFIATISVGYICAYKIL